MKGNNNIFFFLYVVLRCVCVWTRMGGYTSSSYRSTTSQLNVGASSLFFYFICIDVSGWLILLLFQISECITSSNCSLLCY